MGVLYGTSIAWGVGTGIWIDAEAEVKDPGIAIIAPGLFGIAAPAGVFLVDRYAFRRGMPEGLPSAVAAGMLIGAGEGLGITGTQYVLSDEESEWGFKGLARSEVIGATVGGAAGVGLYYGLKPYPETNVMWVSSVFWGTAVGSLIGGGVSNGEWGKDAPVDEPNDEGQLFPCPDIDPADPNANMCDGREQANDTVAIAGLIGFNVGLGAAIAGSIFWTPSWTQLGWMWGGFAIGAAAGAIVYPFYAAAPEADPRRGLVVQAITGTVGLTLGAIFAKPSRSTKRYAMGEEEKEEEDGYEPHDVQIIGGGLMPVRNGAGMQVTGLW
jgi:hypothetical protein